MIVKLPGGYHRLLLSDRGEASAPDVTPERGFLNVINQHFDGVGLVSDIQRNPFRKLTTTFPRRDEFLHIHNVSNAPGGEEPLQVLIDYIEISAPFYEQWPPKTHTDIFIESDNKGDEEIYGREVLNRFLRRVWRRPVTSLEVDQFMALFAKYRPGFSTFEDAMLEVLATALDAVDQYLDQHYSEHLKPLLSYLRTQNRIVPLSEISDHFAWSPDGKQIAFVTADGDREQPEGEVERSFRERVRIASVHEDDHAVEGVVRADDESQHADEGHGDRPLGSAPQHLHHAVEMQQRPHDQCPPDSGHARPAPALVGKRHHEHAQQRQADAGHQLLKFHGRIFAEVAEVAAAESRSPAWAG